MKVLIVDDSRAARLRLRTALKEAGYRGLEVEEASSGETALAKARASIPDLVLADVNMPGMDGLQLLQELKTGGPDVDIGFVTALGSPELERDATNAGAQFILNKPYTIDTLREVLGPYVTWQTVPIERWLDAGVAAMQSIAEKLLGVSPDQMEVLGKAFGDEIPKIEGACGPSVSIKSSRVHLLLAVNANAESHGKLAQAMMSSAMGFPFEEALGIDEVGDCLSEVTNVWGGSFKRAAAGLDRALKLGLPTFNKAGIEVPPRMSLGSAQLSLAGTTVQLWVAGRTIVGGAED